MPNLQRIIALFVFSLIAVAVTACGSSEMAEDDGISKVTPTDTTYAIDDLIAMGFKMNKTYDVEGLTEATDAYYGFWGVGSYDRSEFEVRFYSTHSDAVEFGTAFADERTGTNAILKERDLTWSEGAKDARACTGSCSVSKYGDYVIYGNLILLCQGRDSTTALAQCALLINTLSSISPKA